MKIIIRKPKKSEYAQIVKVVNSELELYKKLFTKKEIKEIGIGSFEISDLEDSKNNNLIAINNKDIFGFISWYIKPNKVAWISMLETDIKKQKTGIGSVLLNEVEKSAKKEKAEAVALETQKKAFWAVNFYKKNDYKILLEEDLQKKPFKETLKKPPVKNTYIFGKIL